MNLEVLYKMYSGYNEFTLEQIKHKVLNPHWGDRIHAWEVYIPDKMIESWVDMSLEMKLVAFLVAQQAAENEDWD